jgi:hypothetical protein
MNLDFAALLSVVHIHQGLKDIVGQLTKSQTARNVGAKHSGAAGRSLWNSSVGGFCNLSADIR